MNAPVTTYSTAPGPTERLAALGLPAGVTVAALREIWAATHPDFRMTAPTFLDCRVCMHRHAVPTLVRLRDLTALEVELMTGEMSRFVVRFIEAGVSGTQERRFTTREQAATFADGKRLHGSSAIVKEVA